MRLLADENFPGDAVQALRHAGHDVNWVAESMPGASDRNVLSHAQYEDRLLITFDKDFGELAFRTGQPASSGIILFRITMASAKQVGDMAVTVLEGRSDWADHFSVVEDTRVRMTALSDSKE